MQPQHSNDLIYSNFDLDGIKALCAHPQLQVEYEDLGGSTKRTRAIALTQYLTHRGRLLDLFIALNGERPHLDLSPCFHELIAEQFSTAETMGSLFAALGLTLRDFQEPERFPWGDFAWCSDKARKLQTYCSQQGQWAALQQTVAAQSRPPLSLETLQRLFPGPGQPVAAAVVPPATGTPVAIAPDRPAPATNAPFQEALERGRLALFIGADFPQTVTGLPSRADLAQTLAQRHGLPAGLTLAQAAQRVSRAGNRHEFTSFLRDALSRAGQAPADFHQRVAALIKAYSLKTVITTAYDDLLEQALRQAGVLYDVVINNSQARFIQPDRLTLIKLYGAAERPDSLVVTEQDHTQLLRDRDRDEVLGEVRRALAQNSVYFLGYNLADPDFAFIYDQVAENRFARTAYALWPGLPQVEIDMWHYRRLEILNTDPLHLVISISISTPNSPPLLPEESIPDLLSDRVEDAQPSPSSKPWQSWSAPPVHLPTSERFLSQEDRGWLAATIGQLTRFQDLPGRRNLLIESQIPDRWIGEISLDRGGTVEVARTVINDLEKRGALPQNRNKHALAGLLGALLDSLGFDDALHAVALIARYQLITAAEERNRLSERFGVPFPPIETETYESLKQPTTVLTFPLRRETVHEKLEALYANGRENWLDIGFLSGGARAAQAVCRLEWRKRGEGTGFLVAPDLILTNYHVLSPPEYTGPLAKRLRNCEVRFGAYRLPDGSISAGNRVTKLHQEAIVAASPIEKLDYVLLRLREPVEDRVRIARATFSDQEIYEEQYANILQHPLGGPMKVALRFNQVVAMRAHRVYYLSDTLEGSSGSPVFDDEWQVIALHRAAKLNDEQGEVIDKANEGVPILEILPEIKPFLEGDQP